MTFAELKSLVTYELKRAQFFDPLGNDVTATALEFFLNKSAKSLQRLLPVRDAETTVTLTLGPDQGPSGPYPYPVSQLPSPYRFTQAIWLAQLNPLVQNALPLTRYQTYRQFRTAWPIGAAYSSYAGQQVPPPRGYCFQDGVLWLGPDPVSGQPPATIIWAFTRWLDDLVNDDDTNWYTINAPTTVLYGACREAAVWLQEEPLIQMYEAMFQKAYIEVRDSTIRHEETAEGSLTAAMYNGPDSTNTKVLNVTMYG